ncbi:MAG: helix-turn-helix transcriptional regulator [Methylobacter sp.]
MDKSIMSNTPSEPELITRDDIAKMTGVSRSKIARTVIDKHLNFPQPHAINNKTEYFKADAVKAWLKENDVKKIIPLDSGNGRQTGSLDNSLANLFIRRKGVNA